jgi:hypothetical protein
VCVCFGGGYGGAQGRRMLRRELKEGAGSWRLTRSVQPACTKVQKSIRVMHFKGVRLAAQYGYILWCKREL